MENSRPGLWEGFLKLEAAGGILLLLAMVLAMVFANTPLVFLYDLLLDLPLEIRIGTLELAKPLLLWINDGLMALFFLLVGLEVKREMLTGHLSKPSQIALPAIAAVGGMLVPALVYTALNYADPVAMRGWAIPTATDIAFALGVLSLLGKRVPLALKLFLMTLAIIDDLGAIIIIAIFYTVDLSVASLSVAGAAIAVLVLMNRLGVIRVSAYMVVGGILWVSVLKSGVHATLAGVVLALTIPMTAKSGEGKALPSPLLQVEKGLHSWVAFVIMPLFAFANAGVELNADALRLLQEAVPMGVLLGLFVGKQLGVFGFSWVAIKLGIAPMPTGSSWRQLYGISLLTGVGFTMSLFIGSLAFEGSNDYASADRLAVLLGSILSAVVGYLVLRFAPLSQPVPTPVSEPAMAAQSRPQ